MSKLPDKPSPHRIFMRFDSVGSHLEISGTGWGVLAVCLLFVAYAGARAAGF